MGKAKRNRAARQRRATVREAIGELLQIRELERFLEWRLEHAALQAEILAELRSAGEREDTEVYEPWIELLRGASPEAAWGELQAEMEAAEAEDKELEDELEAAYRALEEGAPQRALELIEAAEARGSGHPRVLGAFQLLRAMALGALPDGESAERQEEAIAALNRALEVAPAGEPAARVLRQLAALYGERQVGDRRTNLRVARELLAQGIACLAADEPTELLADLQTNLAMLLQRSDEGDRRENLEAALELCEAAIAGSQAAESAEIWAHAQANRGVILAALAGLDGRRVDASAERPYREIIAAKERIEDPLVLAGAHYELARLARARSEPTNEERVLAFQRGDAEVQEDAQLAHAERALAELDATDAVLGGSEARSASARVATERCCVLDRLGRHGEAIEAGRAAIAQLDPIRMPRACLLAGRKLGALLIDEQQWQEAAAAYRKALAAADLLFHTRVDRAGREEETDDAGLLGRWAALALVGAGQPEEAAVALEASRTRELRYRLRPGTSDAEVIAALPAGLRAEYEEAAAEFGASSPLGSTGAEESRLQEVLSKIRSLPKFDSFGAGIGFEEIAAAAQPGMPLLYVNPTPIGTLLLAVSGEGGVATEFLGEVNSTEIFMRLLGAGSPEEEFDDSRASYFNAVGGFGEIRTTVAAALSEVTPWFGERLAAPVGAQLEELGAVGATLVLCGPLATYPLGAAGCEADGLVSLLDRYELRYAPSASAAAVSQSRAAQRQKAPSRLVGLADPRQAKPLPGARAELGEIARHFEEASLAQGQEADSAFLRARAAGASHLHLACHAGGGVFAPELVGVELADGVLAAQALSAVARLRSRLTVVSACQTAVPDIGRLPGETRSVATALILAGAACVIASLWPVDDAATALLMTRLYEELFGESRPSPALALRRAQLWLRDLDEEGEAAFLAAHPLLEAEYGRRAAEGRQPGRRGAGTGDGPRPYGEPAFWAGFIAVGA